MSTGAKDLRTPSPTARVHSPQRRATVSTATASELIGESLPQPDAAFSTHADHKPTAQPAAASPSTAVHPSPFSGTAHLVPLPANAPPPCTSVPSPSALIPIPEQPAAAGGTPAHVPASVGSSPRDATARTQLGGPRPEGCLGHAPGAKMGAGPGAFVWPSDGAPIQLPPKSATGRYLCAPDGSLRGGPPVLHNVQTNPAAAAAATAGHPGGTGRHDDQGPGHAGGGVRFGFNCPKSRALE